MAEYEIGAKKNISRAIDNSNTKKTPSFIDNRQNKHMNFDAHVIQQTRIINLDDRDMGLANDVTLITNFYNSGVEGLDRTTSTGLLRTDEELIIIGHGNTELVGSEDDSISYDAYSLVNSIIIPILPLNYTGSIYINCCDSSVVDGSGTSFVNRVHAYLRQGFPSYRGSVRGNEGAVTTTRSGRNSVVPHRYY